METYKILIMVVLYFIPTIIALLRKSKYILWIFLINFIPILGHIAALFIPVFYKTKWQIKFNPLKHKKMVNFNYYW